MMNTYKDAPYFEALYPDLISIYNSIKKQNKLSEINTLLIKYISEKLSIKCEFKNSREVPFHDCKTNYIIKLINYFNGTEYISGLGAKKYQNAIEFDQHNIKLNYTYFGQWILQNPYPQFQGKSYLGGLSILDALFNIGIKGVKNIFEEYAKIEMEIDDEAIH